LHLLAHARLDGLEPAAGGHVLADEVAARRAKRSHVVQQPILGIGGKKRGKTRWFWALDCCLICALALNQSAHHCRPMMMCWWRSGWVWVRLGLTSSSKR
jgi:hypothetical protein